MPLLLILGILDLIAGTALAISGFVPLTAAGLIFAIGIIVTIKGVISYMMAAGNGFYFDLLGILDMLSGIFLILAFYGTALGFFVWFGVAMILKALWSIVMFMVR
ncbi:MAG: hypothetical protein NTY20_02780 [Candidatus Aenigmarchaeota archaeon]|nr:hypothetical protein [Candidatus Aenigmarchaeota archaeon]